MDYSTPCSSPKQTSFDLSSFKGIVFSLLISQKDEPHPISALSSTLETKRTFNETESLLDVRRFWIYCFSKLFVEPHSEPPLKCGLAHLSELAPPANRRSKFANWRSVADAANSCMLETKEPY